jgi:ribonuclease T1
VPRVRRARRPLIALIVLVVALAVGYGVRALRSDHDASPAPTPTVAVTTLPPQVATTIDLIKAGGPFPYPRNDGVVFHNAEHRLPSEPDGYYHEYTVPTPGASTRGARRIITGRAGQFWYTGNHYDSFVRVDVSP